jgi:hypothetical protein
MSAKRLHLSQKLKVALPERIEDGGSGFGTREKALHWDWSFVVFVQPTEVRQAGARVMPDARTATALGFLPFVSRNREERRAWGMGEKTLRRWFPAFFDKDGSGGLVIRRTMS